MTASTSSQNFISTEKGVFRFPPKLFTPPNHNNVLPCLLEAMVLMFAETTPQRNNISDAYEALIHYGVGASSTIPLNSGNSPFYIDGIVEQIFNTGDYGKIKILDLERARTLGDTTTQRVAAANIYLDTCINFFDELATTKAFLNNSTGGIQNFDRVNALTHELLPELREGYTAVRDAIKKFDNSPSTHSF